MKAHRDTVTSVEFINNKECVTAGKDCSILKWNLETNQTTKIGGNKKSYMNIKFGRILDLCFDEDSKLLYSVGSDKHIRVWDERQSEPVAQVSGHKQAVSGVGTENEIYYTCSYDKSVRSWSKKTNTVLEVLYGHTQNINALYMNAYGPVTVSDDKSIRYWKSATGNHTLFNVHDCPVDSVTSINNNLIVSGNQNSDIKICHINKKSTIIEKINAHNEKSITSICTLKNSNVLFSGSSDGNLKIWRINLYEDKISTLTEMLGVLYRIEIPGVINDLKYRNGVLLGAVGREHKHGRWENKPCNNGLLILNIDLENISVLPSYF